MFKMPKISPVALNINHPSGTTAERPTNVVTGQRFFDLTLGKEIVWDGSKWRDDKGVAV